MYFFMCLFVFQVKVYSKNITNVKSLLIESDRGSLKKRLEKAV